LFHEKFVAFTKLIGEALIAKPVVRWSLIALLGFVAGCGTTGFGVPWVPQAPGNTPESVRASREAQARGEAPAAPVRQAPPVQQAPVPGRQMEVAADLVTQSAPPPRSAAAQAASAAAAGTPSAYTQAARYGDLLFVSGQIALDASGNLRGTTIDEQTRQAMENIRAVLDSHRLTMANVVSVTVYMKDLQDFRAMNIAYESYFRSALPARSVIEVARLPRNSLIEISAIAGR
jgi:2-iminobutanoate/2-iminopropanoate deaminase